MLRENEFDRRPETPAGDLPMTEPAPQAGSADVAVVESPALSEISGRGDGGGTHGLVIVLTADGTIRRRRAGSADAPEIDTVIGTAHPELFEQVRSMITP